MNYSACAKLMAVLGFCWLCKPAFAQLTLREAERCIRDGYADYQQHAKSLQGTVQSNLESSIKGKKVLQKRGNHIKQGIKGATLQRDSFPPGDDNSRPKSAAIGKNSKYFFELKNEGTWVVTDLRFKSDDRTAKAEDEIFVLLSPHYRLVGNQPAAVLLGKKEFKVLGHGESVYEQTPAVWIEYEYDQPINKNNSRYVGKVTIDRVFGCLLRDEFTIIEQNGSKIPYVINFEIDRSFGKIAVPKRGLSVGTMGDDYRKLRLDFDILVDPEVAEEQFTLSAFGLPEPQGIVWPTNSHNYFWIGAGAIAVAAGALWFWRKQTRATKEQS